MSDYFQFRFSDGNRTVTRGNPFKLSVNYCLTNTRKNLFSERVLKVTYCLLLVLIASVLTPLKFPSASEVTTLWRYSNLLIIMILLLLSFVNCVSKEIKSIDVNYEIQKLRIMYINHFTALNLIQHLT